MVDLIDRAALIEKLDLLARHEDVFRQTVINGVIFTIESERTVDAVEVVHGEWVFIGDYDSRCSVCGKEYCIGPDEDYNYCPNCGAKMDGET